MCDCVNAALPSFKQTAYLRLSWPHRDDKTTIYGTIQFFQFRHFFLITNWNKPNL